jgi:hypothetical protein
MKKGHHDSYWLHSVVRKEKYISLCWVGHVVRIGKTRSATSVQENFSNNGRPGSCSFVTPQVEHRKIALN